MKLLNFVLLLLFQTSVGHSQYRPTIDTSFVTKVLKDSFIVKHSYKSLPTAIQEYLTETYKKKFVIKNKKFNASDVDKGGSTPRKLSYVGISKDVYILSYDHGGKGHHHHSIIFVVDVDKIVAVYNLIT